MVDLSNTWAFDIETRMKKGIYANFYQKAEEFLCLVAQNVVTNEVKVWTKDDDLDEMFKFLFSVDFLAGHNIRSFDVKALAMLFPDHKQALYDIQLIDSRWLLLKDEETKALGLFTYAQMKAFDKAGGYPETKTPNSLKSWGYRLDEHKLDVYSEYTDDDWCNLELTEELVTYCAQDVNLSVKVLLFALKEKGVKHNAKME